MITFGIIPLKKVKIMKILAFFSLDFVMFMVFSDF